jgi:CRP-like cAMP-binding protein
MEFSPGKTETSLTSAKSMPRFQTPKPSPLRPGRKSPTLPTLSTRKALTPERLKLSNSPAPKTTDPKSLKAYIPDWLMNREDFSTFLQEMTENSKNIDQICLQHHSFRSTEEKKALFHWVFSIPFFNKMPKNLVSEICDFLTTKVYREGEIFIKRGSEADCLFIIYSGTAGILINGKKVATRAASEVVGETALDNDHPRNADVVAESVVIALMLKKTYYLYKTMHFKRQERLESRTLLKKIPIFTHWSSARLENFVSFLVTSHFSANQVIYEENSESGNLFIVKTGKILIQKTVQVTQVNKWPIGLNDWKTRKVRKKNEFLVKSLKEGDIFGLEVFSNGLRKTRAISEVLSTVLVLNKIDCDELFKKDEEIALVRFGPRVPTEGAMKDQVVKMIVEKQRKVDLFHDALELNFKDWGGRETDLEKGLRKKTRCLSSIKMSVKY